MLTIKAMIDDLSNINEAKLVEVSDKLWKIGSLEKIKEEVSPDLFCLHVAANMMGSWKGEGWWCLICEHADLVPYIPMALDWLKLPELKIAFENVIKLFPEYTVFRANDETYYDICNFLQSVSIKVNDERLKNIASNERRALVKQVRQKVNILEDMTEPLWSDSSECGAWEYISASVQRI